MEDINIRTKITPLQIMMQNTGFVTETKYFWMINSKIT